MASLPDRQIGPADAEGRADDLLSTSALADTYTKTKYPIVLVHGMLGFDRLLGCLVRAEGGAGRAESHELGTFAQGRPEGACGQDHLGLGRTHGGLLINDLVD